MTSATCTGMFWGGSYIRPGCRLTGGRCQSTPGTRLLAGSDLNKAAALWFHEVWVGPTNTKPTRTGILAASWGAFGCKWPRQVHALPKGSSFSPFVGFITCNMFSSEEIGLDRHLANTYLTWRVSLLVSHSPDRHSVQQSVSFWLYSSRHVLRPTGGPVYP